MACFIRDVRKELAAPKMPFVIGVIGVHGDNARGGLANLRPVDARVSLRFQDAAPSGDRFMSRTMFIIAQPMGTSTSSARQAA